MIERPRPSVRPIPAGTARTLAAVALAAALATSAALAAGGRVSGKVLDESGAPLDGVVLRFVAEGTGSPAVPPVDVKKGKFAVGNFPKGPHRVEVEGGGWVIRRIEMEVRDAQNNVVGDLAADIGPGVLPPSFEVTGSQRAKLTLTLAVPAEGERVVSAVGIAKAAATSAELTRLNDLLEREDMPGLLAAADEVLASEPDLGPAMYLRGVAKWKTGDVSGAIADLRRAAEIDSGQPGVHGVLGEVLLGEGDRLAQAGRDDEARAAFGEAADAMAAQIADSPDEIAWVHNRVIALDRAGRTDEAIAALRELIAADPSNRRAYLRLGELLTDAGRSQEALDVLATVPEPAADVAIATYNAAVPPFNRGETDVVIAAMRRAIGYAPDLPYLHGMLGRALLGAGDREGALAEFREVVRLAPDDPEAEAVKPLIEALSGGN